VPTGAASCEVEVTVEEGAALASTTFGDVVLEQAPPGHDEAVVTGPLFVPRYMAKPIITMITMTIAAPNAGETPARDSSSLMPIDLMGNDFRFGFSVMRRFLQEFHLKRTPSVDSNQVFL